MKKIKLKKILVMAYMTYSVIADLIVIGGIIYLIFAG